jgi:hypothetical protein
LSEGLKAPYALARSLLRRVRERILGAPRGVSAPRGLDMSRMILVTGFTRGGTSWLRSCIAEHPSVQAIPGELVLFREFADDPEGLQRRYAEAIAREELHGPYFVNKAPANAPYVGKVARHFPMAKFVFLVRDPRDVLVSHQRGNQPWMRGANSTVEGCMAKIRRHYEGYLDARLPNVLLVRYEDLHQDFVPTLRRVFAFAGLEAGEELLAEIYRRWNFASRAGRITEDRDAAARKGVIGDWGVHLKRAEIEWYERDPFWSAFLTEYGYSAAPLTYERLLQAMAAAGFTTLSVDEMLDRAAPVTGKRLVLLHDVDRLLPSASQEGVREAARLERALGFRSVFNFLPLDDSRYERLRPEAVVALQRELLTLNPRAEIGLHLNATERFFPAQAPAVAEDHPDMAKAMAYLHAQVDAYGAHGVRFRLATAHGYGRGRKRPNNHDTRAFTLALLERGVTLFDTRVRKFLKRKAARYVRMSDVGGIQNVDGIEGAAPVDAVDTYRSLPEGTVIEVLTHPGNFDPRAPLPLGMRRPLRRRAQP